jgi:alanine racemase
MDPGNFEELGVSLEPALELKTQISFIKGVRPNTPIGYECTYRTYRSTKIATCPIGYNDGFPVSLSNNADVIIRGRRAPVVGGVTMDYITVDVGHIGDVEVGDEVTIIGTDGGASITAEELARRRGSIPYEVTCSLGKRVKRIYRDAAAGGEQAWKIERKTA